MGRCGAARTAWSGTPGMQDRDVRAAGRHIQQIKIKYDGIEGLTSSELGLRGI